MELTLPSSGGGGGGGGGGSLYLDAYEVPFSLEENMQRAPSFHGHLMDGEPTASPNLSDGGLGLEYTMKNYSEHQELTVQPPALLTLALRCSIKL